MHILVTGAAGFIGSHLCEALVAAGHRVTGVDAFVDYYARERKEGNLEGLLASPGFRFHELDLRTDPLEPVLEDVEAVVNEAAMPGLVRSWVDFGAYASCNLLAVERLAAASARVGVERFVQVSTSSVYGREAVGDESVPTRPVSPYGVTKLAAEHLLAAYAGELGLPVVVLRYFSIYGPRQRPDMAYSIFIDSLLAGRPIRIFGDGLQSRSSTFVSDCVRGTVQALHDATPGETYNIGGGEVVTLLEALDILADCLGVEPDLRREASRTGDQRATAADTGKARRAFGYEPRVSPKKGLGRQVSWRLAQDPPRLPSRSDQTGTAPWRRSGP